MFTEDALTSESPLTENIFSGETIFLYFDSNIPEHQHDIRKQLRFQRATISQFFDKDMSIVLANTGAAKTCKSCNDQSFSQKTLSRGAIMVREAPV